MLSFPGSIHTECDNFIAEIIYEPTSYPFLQELHFDVVVEYDLPFLMLERRNYGNRYAKRIRKVGLLFVPFFLRNRLSLLLEGSPTERPSNIELSIESTREIICDSSVYVLISLLVPC